jgi:hypothetical protein
MRLFKWTTELRICLKAQLKYTDLHVSREEDGLYCLSHADSLLGLFVPGVGGDILLRTFIVLHRTARRCIAKDRTIFSMFCCSVITFSPTEYLLFSLECSCIADILLRGSASSYYHSALDEVRWTSYQTELQSCVITLISVKWKPTKYFGW